MRVPEPFSVRMNRCPERSDRDGDLFLANGFALAQMATMERAYRAV